MKKSAVILWVLFLGVCIGDIHIYSQDKTTIAVLDLNGEGISESDTRIISSRLRTDLFNTGIYVMVERERMNAIINEQGFQLSGCTSNECAVQIGRLLEVQQIVAGDIGKIGQLYTINIRLIDVETGELIKTATEDCKCPIETVLTESVKNVAEILSGAKIATTAYSKDQKTPIPPFRDITLQPQDNRIQTDRVLYHDEIRRANSYRLWGGLLAGVGLVGMIAAQSEISDLSSGATMEDRQSSIILMTGGVICSATGYFLIVKGYRIKKAAQSKYQFSLNFNRSNGICQIVLFYSF